MPSNPSYGYRPNPTVYNQLARMHPSWSQNQITSYMFNNTSTGTPYQLDSTADGSMGRPAAAPATGAAGNSAQQWLNDVLSGKNLPFNAQVQAQQISQASDMNAAGEAARNNQIDANAAAGGASARDPSLQGAKAANFARRQTDNQTSARDIMERGVGLNFNAQAGAASELNNNQMQREGWAQQAAMQRQGAMFNRPQEGGGGGHVRGSPLGFQLNSPSFAFTPPKQKQNGFWAGAGGQGGRPSKSAPGTDPDDYRILN